MRVEVYQCKQVGATFRAKNVPYVHESGFIHIGFKGFSDILYCLKALRMSNACDLVALKDLDYSRSL